MQINRLFEIVYLLLERGSVTASELAERFEVSTRTVYRDVEALSEAGVPVYATRGRRGGISLMENFSLNRSLLTAKEQDEILFALQSVKATSAAECEGLLTRLGGLFRRESADWIEVDFSDWGNDGEQRGRFELIRRGILECRVLRFVYYGSSGEKSERSVEPVKLLFKSAWYLLAYCRNRQDFRLFKIQRMDSPALTDEHFVRRTPPKREPASGPEAEVRLRLRFSPRAAFRVYDEFRPDWIEKQEDGSFLVSASFPENGWVYGYLLSFGEDVEVLEPERIRKILLSKAEKIENCYRKKQNMTD